MAGTTRDIVEQAVQLGEIRLNLFDTAGVRDVGADGDAIEAEGIRRSWKKLDEAGLVLAVFDAAQPIDRRRFRNCPPLPELLCVGNFGTKRSGRFHGERGPDLAALF